MSFRPFLSHKREDAPDLEVLRSELSVRGAGGWQDTHDLRLGERWGAAFRRAIGHETGGFMWWGTRASLTSKTICKLEVRAALRRARLQHNGSYPVVPLFIDLSPSRDREAIKRAFGRRRARRLLELHGLVREDGEELAAFAKRAARRYVHDVVLGRAGDTLRIAITGGRAPTGETDLTLDWRLLLDERGCVDEPAALATVGEALADIRNAAQSNAAVPNFVVEPHLRLPLAALVGWEWNRVRPVRLTVLQRTTRGVLEVTEVSSSDSPEATRWERGGDGPWVLAVSVGKDLGRAVWSYAHDRDAAGATHLHVSADQEPNHELSPERVASVARWTIDRLAELNAEGKEKHLLLLGPASLAVLIGHGANGTGRTWVPFWDGALGYAGGVTLG